MPIYEFKCAKGHVSERDSSVSERRSSVLCSRCNRIARRVFSQFNAPIKLRHRAVGDDEDRALKAFRQEGEDHDRAVERSHKDREKEARG